jgi:hypothetical protein
MQSKLESMALEFILDGVLPYYDLYGHTKTPTAKDIHHPWAASRHFWGDFMAETMNIFKVRHRQQISSWCDRYRSHCSLEMVADHEKVTNSVTSMEQ